MVPQKVVKHGQITHHVKTKQVEEGWSNVNALKLCDDSIKFKRVSGR